MHRVVVTFLYGADRLLDSWRPLRCKHFDPYGQVMDTVILAALSVAGVTWSMSGLVCCFYFIPVIGKKVPTVLSGVYSEVSTWKSQGTWCQVLILLITASSYLFLEILGADVMQYECLIITEKGTEIINPPAPLLAFIQPIAIGTCCGHPHSASRWLPLE